MLFLFLVTHGINVYRAVATYLNDTSNFLRQFPWEGHSLQMM